MDTESVRTDLGVAAAAAGSTVALAIAFAVALPTEPDFYLQAAPLSVYFVYVFAHRKLPDSVDQPATWSGLAVAAAVGAFGLAVL